MLDTESEKKIKINFIFTLIYATNLDKSQNHKNFKKLPRNSCQTYQTTGKLNRILTKYVYKTYQNSGKRRNSFESRNVEREEATSGTQGGLQPLVLLLLHPDQVPVFVRNEFVAIRMAVLHARDDPPAVTQARPHRHHFSGNLGKLKMKR
jgi:hypothetical protein